MANNLVRLFEKATKMYNFFRNPDYYFPILRIHMDPRRCKYFCFSSSPIEDKYVIYLIVCISNMSEYLKMLKMT